MEKEAPYFTEAFAKRLPTNYYYQGKAIRAWEGVEGGGNFWFYISKSVETEGTQNLQKQQLDPALVKIEERYILYLTITQLRRKIERVLI